MASPSTPRRPKPPAIADCSARGIDNVSFSEPCPRCATKKRHCLHAGCGSLKKLHLMAFPATPTVPFQLQMPLQRSFSVPICGAATPAKNPAILRTYSDHVAMGRINDVFAGLRLAVEQNSSRAETSTPPVVNGKKELIEGASRETKKRDRKMMRATRTRRRLFMEKIVKESNEKRSDVSPSMDKKNENEENQQSQETPPLVTEAPTQQPGEKAMEITTSTLLDGSISPAKLSIKMPENSIGATIGRSIRLSDEGRETGDDLPLTLSESEAEVPGNKSGKDLKSTSTWIKELNGRLNMLEQIMEKVIIKKDEKSDNYQPSDGTPPLRTPSLSTPPLMVTTTAIVPASKVEQVEKELTPTSYFLCSCKRTYKFCSA